MTGPRRTPLHETHRRLSARLVDFAGFEMPLHYGSQVAEHRAVRSAAGLFDVSHMGQIALTGADAVRIADRLLTRAASPIRPGRVRYALLCNDAGGVVDDVTVYRLAEDALFLCVNAANVEKVYRWVVRHGAGDAAIRNTSEATGLLALQGPASAGILRRVADAVPADLSRYAFDRLSLAGTTALVSRTGYTGEDGFEIYVGVGDLVRVFETLLAEGKPLGLVPAGLGARDTLRLEAALPLYGHELDEATTPLEAGLERFVELERGGFLGAEALRRQQAAGLPRRLAGFALEERGVARAGHAVWHAGRAVGSVTSGAPSPTLGTSIGLAWLPPDLARPGTPLEIAIRGRGARARVVETPFVRAGAPRAGRPQPS
jgi:aminomethyltransferase